MADRRLWERRSARMPFLCSSIAYKAQHPRLTDEQADAGDSGVMMLAKSHRLRTGRYSQRNQAYLCTAKTHRRKPRFAEFRFGRIVVEEMRACDVQGFTATWSFVVMPDHVHWLFQLVGDESVSAIMSRMKARSARQINRLSGATGTIWQRGFHDHWVREEESVRRIAQYIVANPVRAGLVESVRDYPLWDAKWL